ncbi:MAG: GtrA family protein [Mycobacteriales bacterium]
MHLPEFVTHQWRVFAAELSKFGVIGAVNTVLDFGVFNTLHFALGVGLLTSQAIAMVIAATSSYFMNRHWTFAKRARSGMRREYILFFLLNLVGLAILEACLAVTRYGMGLDSVAALNGAKVVGLILGTAFRFWSYRRWVFLADGHLAIEEQPDESPEPIIVTPSG